eukprot:2710776-Rhodomonas_salina.2
MRRSSRASCELRVASLRGSFWNTTACVQVREISVLDPAQHKATVTRKSAEWPKKACSHSLSAEGGHK